ncbi:hypothetical protein JOC95_003530 [Bacillus tianshenii]|uniref:Uncharacterized protein n=1 Tax=Sutcliffiella tianshenii TaxID=1463404 RepID=A0ABS2P3U2_9BACI|nr:hypothetical protein [Bacillus tianshenii]
MELAALFVCRSGPCTARVKIDPIIGKCSIEREKCPIEFENSSIEFKKSSIDLKKSPIDLKKSSIDSHSTAPNPKTLS